jgi:elongation factor Ts
MSQITAADVSKLRKLTGAGMMDCKNALVEADGNIDKAIEIIRKKGMAIANKRADREAGEGVVLAKTSADNKAGYMVVLNCETDFVAKNENFINIVKSILDSAVENKAKNLDELKILKANGRVISDIVLDQMAAIGEKIELSYYEVVESNFVSIYIHAGNKLASVVGFSKAIDANIAKDVAMQVAAMNPVAVDKDNVSTEMIEKELEIGREQARREGKPENMLDKIAQGKLNKFYSESTLVNQEFIKDSKKTVGQMLLEIDKDVKITGFKRFSLTL